MAGVYYVYIFASERNGPLYIGVTNDLARRVWEHREGLVPGFTKTYGVWQLVRYELFEDVRNAIDRETRLKKWKRQWKIDLIQTHNVFRDDLYRTING
jgi:putative endonuclease